MTTNDLIRLWQLASEDLGLEIIVPYCLPLHSGVTIKADLLLRNFGMPNGMIIVTSYEGITLYADEIINEGFGYSVMGKRDEEDRYEREGFISILCDWGWTGKKSYRPEWLNL